MRFSPLGLAVSVAVLAPNLLLIWLPPHGPAVADAASRPLVWLERAGQALTLVVPAIVEPGRLNPWWSLPSAVALVADYALWIRYVRHGRTYALLYRAWWGIPVPMAILPVVVFLTASGWLGTVWIALAALVLATGHIPVSVITACALQRAGVNGSPPPTPR